MSKCVKCGGYQYPGFGMMADSCTCVVKPTPESPGPTTTPVEKREEDVATDGVWTAARLKEAVAEWKNACSDADEFNFVTGWAFAIACFKEHAESQPISNPLVTYEEALDAWMEDVGKMLDVKSRAMALAGFQDGWKAAREGKS